jgi:hypothetical protein
MFKFSFDDVASMAREAGFERIQGKGTGVQYFLLATRQVAGTGNRRSH